MIERLWSSGIIGSSETVALLISPVVGWMIARAVQNQLDGRPWLSKLSDGIMSGSAAVAGVMCVGVAVSVGLLPTPLALVSCVLAALLIASSYYDLKTYILPDGLTLAVFVLGVVHALTVQPQSAWLNATLGGVFGFGFLYLIEIYYRRVRSQSGLGRGDAKLMGALGVWVGAMNLPFALLVGSGAALLSIGVVAALRGQAISRSAHIAFGPWLALGAWLVWICRAVFPSSPF